MLLRIRRKELTIVTGHQQAVPHLWKYFVLNQILPMSFTQGLFCTAMTVSRLKIKPRCAQRSLRQTRITALLCYVSVLFYVPRTIGTNLFFPTLFTMRALLFAPFLIDLSAYRASGVLGTFHTDLELRRTNVLSLTVLAIYGLFCLLRLEGQSLRTDTTNHNNYAAAALVNDMIIGIIATTLYACT